MFILLAINKNNLSCSSFEVVGGYGAVEQRKRRVLFPSDPDWQREAGNLITGIAIRRCDQRTGAP